MTYSAFLQGETFWHDDLNGVRRGAVFIREKNGDKSHIRFVDEAGHWNGFAVMSPGQARIWFLQATGRLA